MRGTNQTFCWLTSEAEYGKNISSSPPLLEFRVPPRLPLIRLRSHPLSPSLTWFLACSQRQFLDSDREEKCSGWYPVERKIKKWSFGWSSSCLLLFLVIDSWIWLGESVGLVWWRKMDKWMLCVILLWVPLASGASLNEEGMCLYWWFGSEVDRWMCWGLLTNYFDRCVDPWFV